MPRLSALQYLNAIKARDENIKILNEYYKNRFADSGIAGVQEEEPDLEMDPIVIDESWECLSGLGAVAVAVACLVIAIAGIAAVNNLCECSSDIRPLTAESQE